MLTSDDGHHSKCLSSIVFLFCGLTAWGGERGYDQNDMVTNTGAVNWLSVNVLYD